MTCLDSLHDLILANDNVHLRRLVGPQLRLAPNLLRHRHPGLAQRFIERRRVALIGALQRDRQHRARVQIDRVLGLVRQMRAPILTSSQSARPRPPGSSTLYSTCASCACDPAAPSLRASASRFPTPSQPAQKLLVTRARVSPHNRAHRRVRLQRRRIDRDRSLASGLQKSASRPDEKNLDKSHFTGVNRYSKCVYYHLNQESCR